MAIPVEITPAVYEFGGVAPGSVGPDITPVSDLPSFSGGFQIKEAPVDAKVTLRLTGDTEHFAIRDAFTLEWVEEWIDPGEGGDGPPHRPPGHKVKVRVLEVAGQTDGTSPLDIKKGQMLLVRVQYSALFAEGYFTAALIVEGDTWEPASATMSLFPALVTTNASDTLTIAQGGQAGLPVVAYSVSGPIVDLHYEMSPTQLHTGLSLLPNGMQLQPRQVQPLTLIFQADQDAPLGANQVAIDQFAFQRRGFFISANIVHAAITVNAAIPNQIRLLRPDTRVQIPVHIDLNGGPPASVYFDLPAGSPIYLSLVGGGFSVESNTTVTLVVDVGHDALSDFPFSVEWTAFNGEQTGRLDFAVTIREETRVWSATGQTTPATLGGSAELWVNSDGYWGFRGHVHDSGFFDLFYASLVTLDLHDTTLEARVFQENGNVTGTGNPFGSRDDGWILTGRDPVFSDHWDAVKTAEAHFRLHANAEFFDVLEVVLYPFLAEIGIVKFVVEQIGDISIGGGTAPKPVQCEFGATNDGPYLHCE